MKRRDFLSGTLATGAGLWAAGCVAAKDDSTGTTTSNDSQGGSPMAFQQPPLPYELGALAPFLTEEQMNYHYNKHHAGYFKKLNAAVEGTPMADKSLRELVIETDGGVYNNAAQAWNHSFFWNCMTPEGGGEPSGELAEAIKRDFGSLEDMKKQFNETSTGVFGSGWGWLAKAKDGTLKIVPGSNAENPLTEGMEPVLTVDVWEHAYYLDYQNRRADFVKGFWDHVNWDFASKAFAGEAA